MTIDPKAALKAAILQPAVRALFAASDYDEIGTRLLCRTAQIQNSSLFYAFENKRGVAISLYTQACQRRDAIVLAALAAFPLDTRAAITEVVGQLVRFTASEETDALLLRRLRSAVTGSEPFKDDPDGLAGLIAKLEVWLTEKAAVGQSIAMPAAAVVAFLLGPARMLAELKAPGQPVVTDEMISQLAHQVWVALANSADAHPPRKIPAKERPAKREEQRELF